METWSLQNTFQHIFVTLPKNSPSQSNILSTALVWASGTQIEIRVKEILSHVQ